MQKNPGRLGVDRYIKKVFETGKHGDAREESYYPALNSLLESYARKTSTALAKTIEMQHEIDELYPQVEKDVVTIAS